MTSVRSFVLLSVPWATGPARLPQSWDGRDNSPVHRHGSPVRNDGAGVARQRDLGIIDVSAVRREEPGTGEVVLLEKSRRTNAMAVSRRMRRESFLSV